MNIAFIKLVLTPSLITFGPLFMVLWADQPHAIISPMIGVFMLMTGLIFINTTMISQNKRITELEEKIAKLTNEKEMR